MNNSAGMSPPYKNDLILPNLIKKNLGQITLFNKSLLDMPLERFKKISLNFIGGMGGPLVSKLLGGC